MKCEIWKHWIKQELVTSTIYRFVPGRNQKQDENKSLSRSIFVPRTCFRAFNCVLHMLANLITNNIFGWNVFFVKIVLMVFFGYNAGREGFCTRFRILRKQNPWLLIDKIFWMADTWHAMCVGISKLNRTHQPWRPPSSHSPQSPWCPTPAAAACDNQPECCATRLYR
jgi:hypothetical protein